MSAKLVSLSLDQQEFLFPMLIPQVKELRCSMATSAIPGLTVAWFSAFMIETNRSLWLSVLLGCVWRSVRTVDFYPKSEDTGNTVSSITSFSDKNNIMSSKFSTMSLIPELRILNNVTHQFRNCQSKKSHR